MKWQTHGANEEFVNVGYLDRKKTKSLFDQKTLHFLRPLLCIHTNLKGHGAVIHDCTDKGGMIFLHKALIY